LEDVAESAEDACLDFALTPQRIYGGIKRMSIRLSWQSGSSGLKAFLLIAVGMLLLAPPAWPSEPPAPAEIRQLVKD
jgi:hypothetical protein